MIDRERKRERQRHRQREKQAPCQEPEAELDPGTLGSCPGPKAGARPRSHPGIPGSTPFKSLPKGTELGLEVSLQVRNIAPGAQKSSRD